MKAQLAEAGITMDVQLVDCGDGCRPTGTPATST